jgi:hypothetical protein
MNEQADTHGLSVSALLRYAVLYYLSEHEARRVAWRVPRFARSPTQADHEGRLEVSLELENRVWRSLEAESERQRVPLAQTARACRILLLERPGVRRGGSAAAHQP